MKKPEWPGIATAVAIILILTMIAWLGLWGPVDVSHLKDWQTLMASVFALIAAGIAYRGATAKVRYDREIAERDDMRRKLALYLKVEIAFSQLVETLRSRQGKFIFFESIENVSFAAEDFDFEEPPELEEAWGSLDIFPRHLIAEIRNVRSWLRKLKSFKAEIGDRKVRPDSPLDEQPWLIEHGNEAINNAWQSAAVVVQDLKPLIHDLAPEMDENDRFFKLHGEPDDRALDYDEE
ncbi:hypothetical protein [Bradyrhizobium diazoefficiens]|uniref:Uncharacterized protein n=1 Tax=Bradyrhizobium diazoefficiens TaxID=1355477 RepID=A0A810BEM8_9BRAD|nr:hypothetical protein XF8B_40320 [Bradyrhizobium diazoefficiens]